VDIVIALIGAVATIAAAIISVRANRRPSTEPSVSHSGDAAAGVGGDIAGPELAVPTLVSTAGTAGRVVGAAVSFLLSALALATLVNVVHDVDSGDSPLTDPPVLIGMIVLVAAVAVLWNLARLMIRPIGTRSPVRATLLLAVNVVVYGVTLAMMAGLWQS